MTEPLLRVEDLTKHFPVTRGVFGHVVGQVRAVDGVSFEIEPGETLGLVGESGCGKTTAGRCVLRLIEPTSGRVVFDGRDVTRAKGKDLTQLRRELQIVFQDPYSSLNPRLRVVDLIGEALEVHGLARGAEVERRVAELLRRVGLSPSWINRYPHEFSGGQRQRIGVARAIALEPRLIVCDEAVSALDVSIQAQVVNLLVELRRAMNLSYLFIAHDLSVVRHVSHRIAVMYLGQIVELGTSKRLFQAPAHPYTRALLSAIPVPVPGRRPRRLVLAGDVPTPLNPPPGCRFHTRCPAVRDECRTEPPPNVEIEALHFAKCIHARGLEGAPDWHERMTERIDAAMADNARTVVAVDRPTAPRALEPVAETRAPMEGPRRPSLDPRSVRALGFGGIGLGVLAIVLGAPWVGLLAAMLAYRGFIRPGARERQRWDAAFVFLLAASVLVSTVVGRARKRALAQEELQRLSAEISARESITGAPPADLSELGWRLFPIFDQGKPVDPWGRAFRYRTPGSGGRPYDLGSTGPDGVRSGDDVGHVPSRP